MHGRPARVVLVLVFAGIIVTAIAVTSVPMIREYREWKRAVAVDRYVHTTSTALPYLSGVQTDRLVVLSPGPVRLRVWARSLFGRIGFRLTGSDGNEHLAAASTRFAWDGTVELAPGSYGVTREFEGAIPALFVAGIAGDVQQLRWPAERITKVEPGDADAFAWPFYLYTPSGLSERTVPLLVAPNDTGMPHEQYAVHDAHAVAWLGALIELAEAIPAPLVVPVFPRSPDRPDVNPQSLDRRSLAGELDGLLRLDRQLVSVGERAAAELSLRGVETAPRWLLFGTGAAGLFVNRFSFLHPGRVAIAVAEIPGGWPLTPVEAANLDGLGYPVSTADLDAFVAEPVTAPELRSVRHVLFTFADTAGSLREAVSAEVAGEVRERFGATLSERWAYAELAYAGFGIRSSFELLDAAPAERGRHAEHPAGDRILGMALSVFRDVEDD